MAAKGRAGEMFTRAKRRVGIENPSAADDDGNVGIVRGALRAFGEGDFDQFLDALKPDATWEAPGNNFPGGESLDGRDGIKDGYIADVGRTFTSFGFLPEKFLDAEDENAVVVFGTFKGEGAEGGAVETPAVQVWQFSGSEAEHVRIYADSAEFPEVITEERQRELEEEEKEEEEGEDSEAEGKDESEAEGKDDSDDEEEEQSESKSEDETGSEEKDEDESEREAQETTGESKGEQSSESKSDSGGDSKSDSSSDDDSDSDESGDREKASSSQSSS